MLIVKIAYVKLPQKKYEDVAFKKLDICKPQTKGALEQEVKEEKAALEKPVDLEEEKKQSDGEIVEKGRTVMAIYKGDPGQSSLRTVDKVGTTSCCTCLLSDLYHLNPRECVTVVKRSTILAWIVPEQTSSV